MTTTVNLTALAETRAKMTPGDLSSRGVSIRRADGHAFGWTSGATDDDEESEFRVGVSNASGLVAEHNAIGVLIDVARTLLLYRAAKTEAMRCRHVWSMDSMDMSLGVSCARADLEVVARQAEHEVAIAKVSL